MMAGNGPTNPIFSLQTYYNYVRSWANAINLEYGLTVDPTDQIVRELEQIQAFNRLQGGRSPSSGLRSNFIKANLILTSMERLPVGQYPYLATTEYLWVPVKAYYAIHAMGMAYLHASTTSVPTDHRRFLAAFSDSIVRLLPFPFNALCFGGPSSRDFQFNNLSVTADEVSTYIQLRNPDYAPIHDALAKSLSTTRNRNLNDIYERARTENVKPGLSRRNLGASEKTRRATLLHATSIADFLYRMRGRANYSDSEMYLAAFDWDGDVVGSYNDLVFLTKVFLRLMTSILAKKIGSSSMNALQDEFLSSANI